MESNTSKTFLMKDGTEKLVDIVDYPDLGGAPDSLDVTTLSDLAKRYIEDIENNEKLEFTCNYTPASFKKIKDLKGTKLEGMGVWFGGTIDTSTGEVTPTGSEGKFTFDGFVSVVPIGAGVSAVRQMKVSVILASKIKFEYTAPSGE